jgi:hypothetical protein
MKKQTFITVTIIALTAIGFTSCKKDDAKKDYSSLFKNTVWTGEFNYTGALTQPVSMEFKDGGQLSRYELSGESAGTWKTENNTISVSFSATSGFKADISADNQLTNIQKVAGGTWTLVNAALNTVAEESMDQTTWTAPNLVLNFKAGNKVDMVLGTAGTTKYNDVIYVRKGKSIRFDASGTYKWFIVNNSNLLYKGVNTFTGNPAIYPFQLTKK